MNKNSQRGITAWDWSTQKHLFIKVLSLKHTSDAEGISQQKKTKSLSKSKKIRLSFLFLQISAKSSVYRKYTDISIAIFNRQQKIILECGIISVNKWKTDFLKTDSN